ncbi:MAG: cache domain-containing protein [Gammaproteobacteria bacterium]|nr:cache domain-containing protein [Gammaproteobacteria bacterium]
MTKPATNNIKHIRFKALLPTVATFILTLGLIIFSTATFFHSQQLQNNHDTTLRAQDGFENHVQRSIVEIGGILQMISGNPALQSAWQEKDRETLSLVAHKIYKDINSAFGITHFYLHTTDGKNYLRAHRPGRFGDHINRKTLLTARRTGEQAAGLEIGTFGHLAFRVTQPWMINGQLVGYLELGEEIGHITSRLKQINGAEIITLIDKQLINENDWQKAFGKKYNWRQMDKWVITSSTMDSIPAELELLPGQGIQSHKQQSGTGFREYAISHLPLTDFSNNAIGYTVVISDITSNEQQLRALLSNIFIAGLLIIGLLTVAYFIYLGKIENQVAQINRALHREIDNHKTAETNLKAKHDELTAINHELESYSYSIAHDLRAPLRSITSFSQIVLDDAADKLTTEDKDNLNRVINAGKRMAELIDDILQLSRITREELSVETINISKTAETIKNQIASSNPGRQVKWDIQPDMFARADARLIERAIENLLNNAWKYTSRTDNAEISFGSVRKNNETVYVVRDNGAGFDMDYAHKLFTAFQRLHNPREFTGSGVGLAIVQRIIHRHHGRVWAEGEVGKGSSFYFTLPVT